MYVNYIKPYQSKVWKHLLILGFSLFLLSSTLQTRDFQTKKEHMEVCSKQKVLNKPEYDLYFIFFVATFCFDDSFAHFDILSVRFMRLSPGMVFNEQLHLVKSLGLGLESLALLLCLRPAVVVQS